MVRLHRVAAALYLAASIPSTERRPPRQQVAPLWQPLLPHLLAGRAGREATLVCDPTPYGATGANLWIGIVWQRRVLSLGWQHVPQQELWPAGAYRINLPSAISEWTFSHFADHLADRDKHEMARIGDAFNREPEPALPRAREDVEVNALIQA